MVVVVMGWDIQLFNPTKIPLQHANISISNDHQMSMPDCTRKVLNIKNSPKTIRCETVDVFLLANAKKHSCNASTLQTEREAHQTSLNPFQAC